MENTVGKRIERIQQWSGLTAGEFSEKVGMLRTQLYRYKSGDQQPGYVILEKILTIYPDISPQWLMLGEGEMVRSQKETPTDEVNESKVSYNSSASEDELINMLKGIRDAISSYVYKAEKAKL